MEGRLNNDGIGVCWGDAKDPKIDFPPSVEPPAPDSTVTVDPKLCWGVPKLDNGVALANAGFG
jgi:hypothetical protein